MAITRDQTSSIATIATGGTGPLTVSFTVKPAAGAKVVLYLWGFDGVASSAPSSVVDNGSPSRTFGEAVSEQTVSTHGSARIWYADNVQPPGGTYSITITLTNNGGGTINFDAGAESILGASTGAPAATSAAQANGVTSLQPGAAGSGTGNYYACCNYGGGTIPSFDTPFATEWNEFSNIPGCGGDYIGDGSQNPTARATSSGNQAICMAIWAPAAAAPVVLIPATLPPLISQFPALGTGALYRIAAVPLVTTTTYDLQAAGGSLSAGASSLAAIEALAAAGGSASVGSSALGTLMALAASGASASAGSAGIGALDPLAATGGSLSAGGAAIATLAALAAAGGSLSSGATDLLIAKLLAAAGGSMTAGGAALAIIEALVAAGGSTSAGSGEVGTLDALVAAGGSLSGGAGALLALEALIAAGGSTSSGSAGVSIVSGAQTYDMSAAGSSLSAGGGALGLVAALAGAGSSSSAGDAGLGALAPLAAGGGSLSSGSAGVGILAALSAAGGASSAGAAAVTLLAALAASGTTTTGGTATLAARLGLSAAGSAASSGATVLLALLLLVAAGGPQTAGAAAIANLGDVTPFREHVDSREPPSRISTRQHAHSIDTTVRGR